MTAEIISGKQTANEWRARLKVEADELKSKGVVPCLTVIMVGDDPASLSYIKGKIKGCAEVGLRSELKRFPASMQEAELLEVIEQCNADEEIDGILVQLPLPPHISEQKVIETICPDKDVDGFHPINIGRMIAGEEALISCTPQGIIQLLKAKDIAIEGKHAVVVGRSNIVGKPVGLLLLKENATVTYCHSKTPDLSTFTRTADILIVAAGRAGLIGADDVKEGAAVIDVGVNRTEDGRLVGDVRFEEVKEKAAYLTPVPGGVGPMTITMLLANTIKAAKKRRGLL